MSKNSELLEPDDMHGPIGRDELITLYFGSRRMISDLVKSNLILASENVHLRAENEELNAWKSGMKGVEEFYSMRYQRDEWR
ncbi:MAG: hypothetical protein EB141_15990, partial [Verrucomicrobia bacterium]|nr:hypothetical protein [Verrucomicrobiota bacterium]